MTFGPSLVTYRAGNLDGAVDEDQRQRKIQEQRQDYAPRVIPQRLVDEIAEGVFVDLRGVPEKPEHLVKCWSNDAVVQFGLGSDSAWK